MPRAHSSSARRTHSVRTLFEDAGEPEGERCTRPIVVGHGLVSLFGSTVRHGLCGVTQHRQRESCAGASLMGTPMALTPTEQELARRNETALRDGLRVAKQANVAAALSVDPGTITRWRTRMREDNERLREALQAVLAWGTDENYERAKAACDTARALLGPNASLSRPQQAEET